MAIVRWMPCTAMLAMCAGSGRTAEPQILAGRIVHVADGDRLTVLDSEKREHRVRLAGIDAPEKKQAFGAKAKAALASRLTGKDGTFIWTSRDKNDRIIGDVRFGDRHINREMVAEG